MKITSFFQYSTINTPDHHLYITLFIILRRVVLGNFNTDIFCMFVERLRCHIYIIKAIKILILYLAKGKNIIFTIFFLLRPFF